MSQYPRFLRLSHLPRMLLWLTILISVVLATWGNSTSWAAPVARPLNQIVPVLPPTYLPRLTSIYIPSCEINLEYCKLTHSVKDVWGDHDWSPDGHTVVFYGRNERPDDDSSAGFSDALYMMDEQGKNHRFLVDFDSIESFSYSPDGTKIVLLGTRLSRGYFNYGLYLYTVDTDEGRFLTDPTETYRLGWPAWSPDSSTIVFSREDIHNFPWDLPQIATIRSDGSDLTLLTDIPYPLAALRPVYSPDGKRIAFEAVNQLSGNSYVFVMNADGSELTDLTSSVVTTVDTTADPPSWTNDSNSIFFGSGSPYAIYKIDVDGNNLVKFIPGSLHVYNLSVSPDGSKILFAGSTGPGSDTGVYTMDIDGSNVFQYRFLHGNFSFVLKWHPDSQHFSYWDGYDLYLRRIY